ncbi:hypothetical protein ACFQH5_20315 [Halomonas salifodinae]|uniref:Uncharacterized protein n=1 Tax=Halomonas salifodinae TaxID=438745 RepID=A0ABW2F3Z8_9GAMM
MNVTMREIAAAIHKPESTVYRWRQDNPNLFRAVKEYAERRSGTSSAKKAPVVAE